MKVIIDPIKITEALKEASYQQPFPNKLNCSKCESNARPILVLDDENGELSKIPIDRPNGHPIHPHDSCCFVLYMCVECGNVNVKWNQA